jgi:hypothetical protein
VNTKTHKYKSTKLYLLKKGNQYVSWDGRTMTDRPSKAIRLSRVVCERKYPGYEMLSFQEAYDRWYAERKAQANLQKTEL